MNAKKILFATDFSAAAEAGLAEAESLAKARWSDAHRVARPKAHHGLRWSTGLWIA